MTAGDAPKKIHLTTPHFILRTVEPDDITLRWATWMSDPAKTRTLNTQPLTLSVDDLRGYLAGFDHRTGHLLGIFERASGTMLGFWEVYIDWQYKEFLINVLIGERGRAVRDAREETEWALHHYFFDELRLDAMRCSTLATNSILVRVLKNYGAVHEHTSTKASATGGPPVEILHFRLTREGFEIQKQRRAERERAAATA